MYSWQDDKEYFHNLISHKHIDHNLITHRLVQRAGVYTSCYPQQSYCKLKPVNTVCCVSLAGFLVADAARLRWPCCMQQQLCSNTVLWHGIRWTVLAVFALLSHSADIVCVRTESNNFKTIKENHIDKQSTKTCFKSKDTFRVLVMAVVRPLQWHHSPVKCQWAKHIGARFRRTVAENGNWKWRYVI